MKCLLLLSTVGFWGQFGIMNIHRFLDVMTECIACSSVSSHRFSQFCCRKLGWWMFHGSICCISTPTSRHGMFLTNIISNIPNKTLIYIDPRHPTLCCNPYYWKRKCCTTPNVLGLTQYSYFICWNFWMVHACLLIHRLFPIEKYGNTILSYLEIWLEMEISIGHPSPMYDLNKILNKMDCYSTMGHICAPLPPTCIPTNACS